LGSSGSGLTGNNGTAGSAGTVDSQTGYRINTNDNGQINTSDWKSINKMVFTEVLPTNTTLKYLFSVDDRTTWKYWDGDSWETSSLANIGTNGNSSTTLAALDSEDWDLLFNDTINTLDVAVELGTTDAMSTPQADNIAITYNQTGVIQVTTEVETTQIDTTTTTVKNVSGSTLYDLRAIFKIEQ
jgi:hypothetical protein